MSKEMQAELYDGENVVMECQFNKIVPVIKLVLGIIFFFLLFIPLGYGIAAYLRWKKKELVITTQRVLARSGVFNIRATELDIEHVKDITVYQPFWGRVFNYGTLTVKSASDADFYTMVKDVQEVKKVISRLGIKDDKHV